MGEYVPARVQMDEGESAAYMAVTTDFKGYMLFVFDNGKVAKVELSAYYTKTSAESSLTRIPDKARLRRRCKFWKTAMCCRRPQAADDCHEHGAHRPEATKSTQGVGGDEPEKGQRITDAHIYQEDELQNPSRYRKKIPALGALPNGEEGGEQISL